jgi:hypothetical protein
MLLLKLVGTSEAHAISWSTWRTWVTRERMRQGFVDQMALWNPR